MFRDVMRGIAALVVGMCLAGPANAVVVPAEGRHGLHMLDVNPAIVGAALLEYSAGGMFDDKGHVMGFGILGPLLTDGVAYFLDTDAKAGDGSVIHFFQDLTWSCEGVCGIYKERKSYKTQVATYSHGTYYITAIPIPAGLPLLTTGLVLLGWNSTRRQRKRFRLRYNYGQG